MPNPPAQYGSDPQAPIFKLPDYVKIGGTYGGGGSAYLNLHNAKFFYSVDAGTKGAGLMFGFLDQDALNYVSASLHVPPSKTYGVATFYHVSHNLVAVKKVGRAGITGPTGAVVFDR